MKDAFSYLKKNRTTLLPFAILLFLALATFLTLILTKQRQDIRQRAALSDNGQLTFANYPTTTVAPGSSFTASVNMTGGGQVVVGADVLVQFDSTKLTLTNITQNTISTNPYKTYAPVTSTGAFDTTRVVNCANSGGTNCPSGQGVVEFGIVSFDWAGNTITSPNATNSNLSPVTNLTFQVKSGAAAGTTPLSIRNLGVTSTVDSNIVVNPAGGGDPEDILQAPGYTNGSINITIGGTASPRPTPRPTPTPSSGPTTCVPATTTQCFDLSGDGVINIQDITSLSNRYNATPANTTLYSYKYDLNCDSVINIIDITSLSNRYNITSCTRQ